VWDNDGVNGAKSTKSSSMYFKVPSLDEIQKSADQSTDKMQNEISKTMQQSEILQNQLEQAKADMYNKKELNWADKKKIKDMLDKQQELQKKTEDLAKQNEKNNEKKWEFQKKDSSLMDKQQQLQNLFNELASDSLKKKIAELQKMLDKMDKNQVQQQMDKIAMDNQDMKKELERTLELFKQLEFQEKLSENIQKMDSLAKQQQKLSDDTKAKKESNSDLQKKQDDLNKKFQEASKDMQDLEKKNSQLESPTEFKNPEQQEQEVQQQQQQSSQQLSKSDNKNASQSQQKAAQGMQKMSESMSAMQQSMQSQQQEADQTTLRAILNNLVQLSFAQEDLMKQSSAQGNMKGTSYAAEAKKQNELQENAKTIEDSLYELSKKVPQIKSIVNKEMSSVNNNMKQAVSSMEANKGFEASSQQQFAMTGINNLSLMMSEILGAMQNASKNHTPGSGSCNKPGGMGSHPSMSQLRKMQESLSKQLSEMKSQMQKSGQGAQGGKKTGKSDQGMSEQLAKMAAEQEFIRSQMQQAEDEMDQNKKGGGALGDVAKQMDKTQEDIVNQQITEATMQRQEEILKHLLEFEKSERTQGQDPNFESHVAKKQFFGNPNPFLEYNTQKTQQNELLKTVPPDFNAFYKDKVNDYFNSFQQ
jgi:hypothetical protein